MDIELLKTNTIDYDGGLVRFMNNMSLYEGLLKQFVKDMEFEMAKIAYKHRDFKTMFSKLKYLSEGCLKLGITGLNEKLENILELAKYEKYDEVDKYFEIVEQEYNHTIEILKKA